MSRAFLVAALLVAGLGWWAPASADEPAPQMPQQLYKYKTKDGRTAYTNILDEVPPEQRAEHKVDLSHVTLNTQVGNELSQRLASEHKELAASPYCQELEQAAAKNELQQLWDDHPVPVVCGALIALMILMTPMMLRNVHPPEWARVLTKMIPTLVLVGGVMYGLQTANEKVNDTRARLKPCLNETFTGLGQSSNPDGERLSLVAQLKRDIEQAKKAAAERDQLLEQIVKER